MHRSHELSRRPPQSRPPPVARPHQAQAARDARGGGGARGGPGGDRVGTGRGRGARADAPAASRRHHPPAGEGQEPRSRADRGGHLRGVALPRPDLARRRARADADHSGGVRFKHEDLADPQINISYGAYYLRLLIDHYSGNGTLAIAAYNAGMGNVDRWVADAGGVDNFDT